MSTTTRRLAPIMPVDAPSRNVSDTETIASLYLTDYITSVDLVQLLYQRRSTADLLRVRTATCTAVVANAV